MRFTLEYFWLALEEHRGCITDFIPCVTDWETAFIGSQLNKVLAYSSCESIQVYDAAVV